MSRRAFKEQMQLTVPGEVAGQQDSRDGRTLVTVELRNGQRVSFDASWLPDAEPGESVSLPGRVTRLALPRVTVKLDWFGTPVTLDQSAFD